MVKHTYAVHKQASIVFEQMRSARRFAPSEAEAAAFFADEDNSYTRILDRLYSEDFALARLMDAADVVVHAEGPAAKDPSPSLRAVNWLCQGVEKNLKILAAATLTMSTSAARSATRKLDLRLTGLAPGSLYAGFSLGTKISNESLFPGIEADALDEMRRAIQGLAELPQYVGEDAMSDGLEEAIPDPALRDASILTAYHLAPTGKIGIHTLEIGTPYHRPATLGQRERVVLKEAAHRPSMRQSFKGSFVGEIREIDLDAGRFHLRGVRGIGSIRCIAHLDRSTARAILGHTVTVTGRYTVDPDGRPRLMQVDHAAPVQEYLQGQLDAGFDS